MTDLLVQKQKEENTGRMLISVGSELNWVIKRVLNRARAGLNWSGRSFSGLTMVPVPAGAHSLSGLLRLIGPIGWTLMDLRANSRWS